MEDDPDLRLLAASLPDEATALAVIGTFQAKGGFYAAAWYSVGPADNPFADFTRDHGVPMPTADEVPEDLPTEVP